MTDVSHLNALHARRGHELQRLAAATKPQEIELRRVWIAQINREIADEMDRLERQYAERYPLPA